jgi:hypothetical protein
MQEEIIDRTYPFLQDPDFEQKAKKAIKQTISGYPNGRVRDPDYRNSGWVRE